MSVFESIERHSNKQCVDVSTDQTTTHAHTPALTHSHGQGQGRVSHLRSLVQSTRNHTKSKVYDHTSDVLSVGTSEGELQVDVLGELLLLPLHHCITASLIINHCITALLNYCITVSLITHHCITRNNVYV
jgi:hypothetical protein